MPTGTLKHTQHVRTGQPQYATYLFMRSQLDIPFVALPGLEKPSVAVRACPRIFSARNAEQKQQPPPPDVAAPAAAPAAATGGDAVAPSAASNEPTASKGSLADTAHRSLFAVLTLDEVLIYDTHQVK